jgi:hypothetical protein
VEPGHLHAEQFHADGHGAHDHDHEDHDEADQPQPLILVPDGTADQVHHGECDGAPSDVREHELLQCVAWASSLPRRTTEPKPRRQETTTGIRFRNLCSEVAPSVSHP